MHDVMSAKCSDSKCDLCALGSDERQDRERLQTSVMNVTTSTVNTFVLLTVDSLDLQSI